MRRRRHLITALLLLALAALIVLLRNRPASSTSAPGVARETPTTPRTAVAAPAVPAAEPPAAALALNAPGADIQADLRLVSEILDTFRSNFPRQGNPTGSNAEITSALLGNNPLKLVLIPKSHPALNREGELCDRWGTPFFFHAESATHMEIRSAGPDKKLWTDDDVAFAP